MSFILDALSRVETLRGRRTGALAGPMAPLRRRGVPQHMRSRAVAAAIVIAVLATAAALWGTWALTSREPVRAQERKALAGPAVSASASPPSAPKVAAARPAAPPSGGVGPAAPSIVLPNLGPRPAAPLTRFAVPATLSQPLPPPSTRHTTGWNASIQIAPASIETATTTAEATVEEPRLLSDLSSELQARIARIKIDVSFYSPQRSRCFVVIDGRQRREGDDLIAGVRLDEITQTGVVLQADGLRVWAPSRAVR